MAKKSKNSELLVHYTRTMTPENLSKAANYVGEYVLKGLGALGKIMTAPLIGGPMGTSTVPLYPRTVLLANAERKLRETQEELLGKAMTWVSPLNYGAAVWNGHGLDARKGEEEVASWSPAWLAVARLGELYVGPKGIKAAKVTPKAVVNVAAKAGSKTAKKAVVAREINKATKKGVQTLELLLPEVRTRYGDVEVNNPQLSYRQGEGITEDFIKKGKVEAAQESEKELITDKRGWTWDFTPRHFDNPMFSQGNPWFGPKGGGGGDMLVTSEPLSLGNFNGALEAWEGNGTFDVRYKLDNLHGPVGRRRVPAEGQVLDINNTIAYKWVPGYGYKKVVQEPPTSLKFFERRPAKISQAERSGATKWERNFRPKWHVANYPGYLLKGLMKGSLLEKQLSKNGTININLLNAYFNKASQLERDVANKVLAEKFAGLKTIDYNLFKKAVLDELINYSTKPQMRYSTYGMDRLGFNVIKESDGAGGIVEYLPGIRTNTFTFESPKLSIGSNKHYDTTTLGHSRTYTTPEEPKILHVMESLSDWGQSHVKMMPSVLAHQVAIEKALKSGNINAFHSFTNRLSSLMRDKLTKYERMALENINKEIESGLPSGFLTVEDLWNKKYEILKKASNRSNIGVLGLHLHDNYLQRQLQENLKFAAENGLTKMRYPTSETAAKIEGYLKTINPKYLELLDKLSELHMKLNELLNQEALHKMFNEPFSIKDNLEETYKVKEELKSVLDEILQVRKNGIEKTYTPEHQTILKKYADFPKLFLKLYKGLNVRTITDAKENTWYEVDVPKGYLNREWQFKQGGKMNILEFLKNGSGIHIKEKNKGKFTSYCGGKVTDECILKGKNSSNPTIRKRATFAANARKWKHKEGGIIKALLGESLDVDKRRDTTGNYITSQLPRWGAVDQPNIAGLWDVLNYNIINNPHIITGEPIILPGRFGGFRSGRLANKRWLENSNPITSEGSALAAKDWLTEMGYKYNPKGKAIEIESTAIEQAAKKRGRPVGSKNKPAPVKEEKPIQVLKTDYTQSGTATERYIEGRRYGIPRKGRVSSNDKNARALEGEDARIKNAGYTNVKKGLILQVEKNLDKYPKFEIENHNKLLLRLYRKNRSEAEINKVKREFYKYLAKKYGYFKIGGVIKANTGTKFNWNSALNTGVNLMGQFIPSIIGGSNNLSYSLGNNYSDIISNTALLYMLNQQLENEVLSNYDNIMSKLHFDPSNPNANGGSIVKNHVNYLAQAPVIAGLKEFNDNYKKFLDEQVKLRKTNYITNALTNTLLTGFDLALNYKPTIKKGSSVS